MILAPIVLFVYNRPSHTQQTVEALQKNELASQSELFIYSDEAKNEDARKSVDEVRSYIDNIDGFKKVMIIERDKNWGLANSIIDGVTKIVNEYGKIIVLEDDLVTSPYFLRFMNDALEFYKDEKKVWHVSGWNYPIETEDLGDVFLWRLMNCWGWATWSDRWSYYEKDTDKVINEFTKEDINRFNLDGAENFFSQVTTNKKGKINTWATYWYVTIFKKDGLCLNPSQTLVDNIGLDGGGVNCSDNDIFSININQKHIKNINVPVIESNLAFERVKRFYKMNRASTFNRIKNKFRNLYFREQFNTSLLGILVNPFYFSRVELSKAMMKLISQLKGTVLDIGCGTKPYEALCICDKYIGIEIDDGRDNTGKNADFYYNGHVLPFERNTIDSVISSQVFEHVSTPDEFLQEINRVLKVNGLLLLSVPFVWDEHEQPHDYVRYTSFGIKNILSKHGFEIIKLKKTANDFSAIVQMLTAYIFKVTKHNNEYINLFVTVFVISPINIIGLLFSKLLPANEDFYLDNVVLARKVN
jgi:SAM-dependent methyltransferase